MPKLAFLVFMKAHFPELKKSIEKRKLIRNE